MYVVMAGSSTKDCCTDEDGFQLVQRRGGRSPRPPPWKPQEYSGPETSVLCARLNSARKEMEGSDFYLELVDVLRKALGLRYVFRELVCYGIGRIGSCHQAQHQFALFLAVMENRKPQSTWVFDPALCEEELQVIQELGCSIITKNELCKRTVSGPTLFFMPHCGKAMYNNLLWANWSAELLAKVAIIGNSFRSYTERLTTARLAQEASFIYRISSHCLEFPLPRYHPEPNAFSDTSLHVFPPQTLRTVPATVWRDCSEPTLDPKDPEIIVT